ncbi:MAG: FAD-dependent oxidoreductase [Candidatus Omnitrophica bacterium]|nr:FAD-dependent oxidoreductase [Candidatus Omnitrophota bacterium]
MKNKPIARRQLLLQSAAGATWITASNKTSEVDSSLSSFDSSKIIMTDVLIIGGGTAGAIASIQSARAGIKTVLIERTGQLGGTATVGGVAFPGLFHAWGRQVISGIGWELVRETVEMDNGTLPDFTIPPSRHWNHQVHINPFLYSALAEEKCLYAGVTLRYYEFPLSIEKTQEGWLLECVGPGTRIKIGCKQLIDCTGGADVVGMLGLPRLREDETQPGSFLFKFGESYQPGREQLQSVYVHGADSSTSEIRTKANLSGRQEILKQLRRKIAQGDKNARLIQLQPEAAIRESYRILGEIIISHDDYIHGYMYEDAVSYAFYPIDLHTKDGVIPKPLEKDIVPTIPLRALVPKNSRNILVAGRCVSSDRLANSGLRVQASCMGMGQAAGATAALAAQRNTTPLEVPLEEIRKLLHKHGAIVPRT